MLCSRSVPLPWLPPVVRIELQLLHVPVASRRSSTTDLSRPTRERSLRLSSRHNLTMGQGRAPHQRHTLLVIPSNLLEPALRQRRSSDQATSLDTRSSPPHSTISTNVLVRTATTLTRDNRALPPRVRDLRSPTHRVPDNLRPITRPLQPDVAHPHRNLLLTLPLEAPLVLQAQPTHNNGSCRNNNNQASSPLHTETTPQTKPHHHREVIPTQLRP